MKFQSQLLIASVLLIFYFSGTGAFLSWIFGGTSSQQESSGPEGQRSAVSTGRVPFEMKTADERFLGSGKELMAGLSDLDVCHHTVVYQLKATCNEMTEEEIAKLGVRLLNCQSQSEGRPTFPCTDSMTVAECTSGMDPNTWNAYHIVSNRARSVCYGVRQQQFQRQTQFAVNQLALSAEGQLHLMEDLRYGQEELNSVASDTLGTISAGQEKLVKTQEMLGSSQSRLKMNVESNIRDLTREKSLIAAGHQELAAMTSSIREQLDAATEQLLDQDLDQEHKHQELMEDLSSLSLLAKDVWSKLDHNMHHMHLHQEETAHHYRQTLDNLEKMNHTISYLINVMTDMQNEINEQLGWVTKVLTFTGENMAVLVTCVLHCCYFFLAAVLSSFLETPFFSRVVLLLVVPLNAAAEMRQGTSLPLPTLSFFIISVVLVNWMILWIMSFKERRRGTVAQVFSPRTIHLPDISHIHGSPTAPNAITYDPSSSPEDGSSGASSHRRLHSTGYTSMLSDTSRHLSSLFGGSSKKRGPKVDNGRRRMEDEEDETETETDISSDEDSIWSTMENTTGRTLTVTNLSIHSEPIPVISEPTPMPNEQSSSGHNMDFGNLTGAAAKRHLGLALSEVPATTPTPGRKKKGTPSSSRSSSPSRRPCSGQTKMGLPCRLPCAAGKDYCYRHAGPLGASVVVTPSKGE